MTNHAETPDLAVLRQATTLDIVDHGGAAVALAWPGTGSQFRGMHRIDLEPGGQTKPLCHQGEAVYTLASGSAMVDAASERHQIAAPTVFFVPSGTEYVLSSVEGATIFGGPCPPDPDLYADSYTPPPSKEDGHGRVQIFDPRTEGLPIPMISKQGRLVVWPGVGAETATMVYVILEPGDENDPHEHESSDDIIAILEGKGSIDDLSNGTNHEFEACDVVFVRAGIRHRVKANRGARIVATGGPCPPDYRMLKAIGAVQ